MSPQVMSAHILHLLFENCSSNPFLLFARILKQSKQLIKKFIIFFSWVVGSRLGLPSPSSPSRSVFFAGSVELLHENQDHGEEPSCTCVVDSAPFYLLPTELGRQRHSTNEVFRSFILALQQPHHIMPLR